ncbi:ABC1 kinase family protein [Litorisediminicola beolgyonensis]|uniref:ABC1 kinase family protein n=1 Tax=Litorisediminicola beolgyonensis TaxID=1173614 RepID=A0ABW3ZMR7_9RHOB
MSETRPEPPRGLPVPSGRLTRMARLGRVAAGIAGSAAWRAAGEYGRGGRPSARDLLITPANLTRLTNELARMRGAAIKIGQLLSMDAGEVLPRELADILARLRDDAHIMPPRQLRQVLDANWGIGWQKKMRRFDPRPLAAASIGQVHRALLRDGRDVAIKVQYPGVARSIDSDIANVGALVRLSGLLPKGFELAPYLDEARRQLHDETDYAREGAALARFGERLADDPRFSVPAFHPDWSTGQCLVMDYLASEPIEAAAALPQPDRNRLATALVELTLTEIFRFGEMQSDPNFANYRHDPATGRIVLLDFGAARTLSPELVRRYRALLEAGLRDQPDRIAALAHELGLLTGSEAPRHRDRILTMIHMVFAALRAPAAFDFAATDLPRRMQAEGRALAEDGYVPPPLPMDVLYLQRKLGGMFLLASRLGAVLPVLDMLEHWLADTA